MKIGMLRKTVIFMLAGKGYLHALCNKRWYYSSKIFKYRSIYCSIEFLITGNFKGSR